MMVFSHSNGGFLTRKPVFQVDYRAEVAQHLVKASHIGNLKAAFECIANPFIDVNFVAVVCLKARKTEVLSHDESANKVWFK